MYIEGDVPYVTNGSNNNGWGNDWSWIIGLALVGALFGGFGGGFGFGRGGFGGFGGFGYGGIGTEFLGYQLGRTATQEDVASGFNNSAVLSNLNSLKEGQLQMINYNNQGFAGLNNTITTGNAGIQQTLCQGFNGINTGILQSANATERGFATTNFNLTNGLNAISHQISDCCCDLKTMNLENRYLNEKQTCEIIGAINAGNQRLVDIYNADKISALTAENTALKGLISNNKQTADIVSQLRDPGCPVASYIVPNPNCCYNPFGFNYGTYGNSNGCSGCNF